VKPPTTPCSTLLPIQGLVKNNHLQQLQQMVEIMFIEKVETWDLTPTIGALVCPPILARLRPSCTNTYEFTSISAKE
jgi:hypothetical protein